MSLFLIMGLPFALAVPVHLLRERIPRRVLGWVLAAFSLALSGVLLPNLSHIAEAGPITQSIGWVPALGLSLTAYLDGLALVFSLLVTGMGAVVLLYTGHYFEENAEAGRFSALTLLFMGAMLGVVLSGNLIMMFIAWELTSITSFLLIGFKGGKSGEAREGAFTALVVTASGGLAMLVGLLMLGAAGGSYEWSEILTMQGLAAHPWYTAFTLLLMIGAFTKSAQMPFHFWLPGAMAAPSPASAYLHSATMVKAGVYLLARAYPALGNTPFWTTTLLAVGLTTMVLAAFLALNKRDLKALLAYSTVSWLGALVALLGLPESIGIKAALVGILVHGFYKAALFLSTGIIEHATGSRILDDIGGLLKPLPATAAIVIVSALSMAGVPPLFGFVGKEVLLAAVLDGPAVWLVAGAAVVGATLTVAAGFLIIGEVFFGKVKGIDHLHKPEFGLAAGPGLLALGSAGLGFVLQPVIIPLLEPAVGKEFELHLFPGINLAFGLSMGALVVGAVIYATRGLWLSWGGFNVLPDARRVYERLMGWMEAAANFLLRTQNGRLHFYLSVILGTVVILMATPGLGYLRGLDFSISISSTQDILKAILLILSMVAAFATVFFERHLLAALAMGFMGYSIGALFLLEPAPDVALVSILVETLGTVLIILMLGTISSEKREAAWQKLWGDNPRKLIPDVLIAGGLAIGLTLFSLAAILSRGERATVSTWYLDNATEETGAADVVAAIVTDIRGGDTMVEITVFSVAALSVLTLLVIPRSTEILRRETSVEASAWRTLQRQAGRETPAIQASDEVGGQSLQTGENPRISTALTRTVAFMVLPFSFLISITHILFGGSAPGDGFTAGVVSGLGVALWYVVFGHDETRTRLHWLHPVRLIGAGLGLAMVNALFPLLLGKPFLAQLHLEGIHPPLGIELASSVIFELSIFLAVFGGVSVIMEAIAHPQEVEGL